MKPYPRRYVLHSAAVRPRKCSAAGQSVRHFLPPKKKVKPFTLIWYQLFNPFPHANTVVCVCVWTVSNTRSVSNPVVISLSSCCVVRWVPVRARPFGFARALSCPSARDFFCRTTCVCLSVLPLSYFGKGGKSTSRPNCLPARKSPESKCRDLRHERVHAQIPHCHWNFTIS